MDPLTNQPPSPSGASLPRCDFCHRPMRPGERHAIIAPGEDGFPTTKCFVQALTGMADPREVLGGRV